MDSHTLVKEIKRLLNENKKRFTRFTLLFMLLLFAVQLVPGVIRYLQEPADDREKTPVELGTNGNPAIFEMYIEYENGSVYTNTLLLEEALKSEQNIQRAEEETGVEISDLLAMEEEVDYPKSARDRGVLGATRNEQSNIWLVIARVGTEEENLRVAEFFHGLVANDEIALLNNKPTYLMSEPRVLTDEDLASPNTIVDVETVVNPFSIRNILSSLVVAIAGGMILAFVLVISKTFLNKKISYAFNYNWSEEDVFITLDREQPKTFERAVLLPPQTKRIILVQNQTSLLVPANVQVAESILNVNVATDVEEVVIIIQPGLTDKTWYNQQRELLKVYRAPLKIIQLNDEKA